MGNVVELEDLTESRQQIRSGRVLVHTLHQEFINEVINLSVHGGVFSVRVIEDFIEVIDSGHATTPVKTSPTLLSAQPTKDLRLLWTLLPAMAVPFRTLR